MIYGIRRHAQQYCREYASKSLRELITAYGPFVMNTKQEIRQAMDDFNQGRFGHLDD